MKRLHFAVGFLAALACSGLQAQTRLEANIPFEFRMGKTTLPAGDYLFDYSSRLLIVHQEDGHHTAVMTLTSPVSRTKAPATGIVEFNRYSDAYFLSKIFTAGSPEGEAVPKSAREKELASRAGPNQTEAIVLQTK
jgi:hypothetical protein